MQIQNWIVSSLTVVTGLLVLPSNADTDRNVSHVTSWTKTQWSETSIRKLQQQHKLQREQIASLARNNTRELSEDDEDDVSQQQFDPSKHNHTLSEAQQSLEMLENLVDTDEELLDEINDRQIIQAVVASMAQWNLRKIQKLQRRKDFGLSHRSRRDEAMVCYAELGCFRDEGPFNYLDLLPAPPEEINTRFFLYTPRNRDTPHAISYSNASSVLNSSFNASLPSKVMVHGFGSSCQRIWAKEMRTALISVGEVNVICVDWENGAKLPNYVQAAVNTRLVGRQVALMVNYINSLMGSSNADFHLIGFSLGAHVAGFAGSDLKNLSRITGLDPAGPLFENYDPRARLDSTDAVLVDVIHSNGEKIYMGGLGAWAPMGDIDFYPNGGRMQKGCTNLFVGAVSDMIWSSSEENGRSLCNHRRAYKLFTDSVVPGCHFPAFTCESYEKLLEGDCFPCTDGERCSNMGYYADKSAGRGIMYLATREEEPFCANQYRVQLHSAVTLTPVTTQGKIELILIGSSNFNETFTLTKGPDFELVSGGKLVRLIVPHPTFSPPTKIHVVYTAYHGWIYSGLTKWPIDKILLTDSFGKSVSYCQKGMFLESGKGLAVTLLPGECNLSPPPQLPPSSAPIVISNSLLMSQGSNVSQFINRQPVETVPVENEITTVDNGVRFRSIDSNLTMAVDKSTSQPNGNTSSNIFPYGNVPLSVLQQQIPADIKVGTNGNGNSSKRPSFYQWPLVGASQAANFFFGGQSRPRFRSRKYEPQGQLTAPPSLQQLQQGAGFGGKEATPPSSRRPYFRRGQQQQMSPEESQSRQEYFLLRQQQLALQQQSTRLRTIPYQPVQSPAPSQWVLAPPQRQVVPVQWRPDAAVEAELPQYAKPEPQNPLLPIRSSIVSSAELPPASLASSVVASSASAQPIANSLATLTTMTISNTLQAQQQRLPDIESGPLGGGLDLHQSESLLASYAAGEEANIVAAVETASLLSAKTPSSNRQMTNDSSLPLPLAIPITGTANSNSTSKVDQPRGNAIATPILTADYPFVSDGSSLAEELYPNPEQLGQARDDYWSSKVHTSKGRQFVTQYAAPTSTLVPSSVVSVHSFPMVMRPPRPDSAFEHKPTYIPINPADRQSRRMQPQFYADQTLASIKQSSAAASDPASPATSNSQRST